MTEMLREATPFNSALETGVGRWRSWRKPIPRLTTCSGCSIFDYLVVHSQDADGPDSLHPSTPLRNGELLVRRGIIERGLLLLISRRLVERHVDAKGISYSASDDAGPFLDCLQTHYAQVLRDRAHWAVDVFGALDDDDLKSYFDARFDRWTREFQAVKLPPETTAVSGFQLRSLRVTGPTLADAEIGFEAGLNVISGPSDTGKSYIVETIDFMLGGATPPAPDPRKHRL